MGMARVRGQGECQRGGWEASPWWDLPGPGKDQRMNGEGGQAKESLKATSFFVDSMA